MKTKILDLSSDDIGSLKSDEILELSSDLLHKGEIIAVPTETVYGLAANAYNEYAVKKIFKAKGRPSDNPLIVHIYNNDMLNDVVSEIPQSAKKLISKFWPGPLTIVFPNKKKTISDIVTAGKNTIAVRMPSHKVFREIIKKSNLPLAAPSANYFGRPSPTSANDVSEDLNGKIPLIISSGPCHSGIESTIISFAKPKPILLRPGVISREDIESIIGEINIHSSILNPNSEINNPESPGMKYKHYSPRAKVVLVKFGENIEDRLSGYLKNKKIEKDKILLVHLKKQKIKKISNIEKKVFLTENDLARSLYSTFREADRNSIKEIIVVSVDSEGIGLGLMNRILKASSLEI